MYYSHRQLQQFVVVIGPAGCGKTTLVGSFGRWIEKNQQREVGYVNLDPGVEYLPYKPDIDAREYVTVEGTMRKYKLGPNGGLIKSIDELLNYSDEIIEKAKGLSQDIILVDTPGQMELFLFRKTGPYFIEAFSNIGTVVSVLVFDPTLAYRPSDVVSLKLMTMVVDFRLGVENILAINKIDAVRESPMVELFDNQEALGRFLEKEKGVLPEVAGEIFKVMNKYGLARRIAKVSALTGEGMNELYDLLHEVYCTCGDLT